LGNFFAHTFLCHQAYNLLPA